MEPEEKICERCHQVKRVASDTCPDDGGRMHTVTNEQALIGRVIDDKLTLTAVLGKGGMGVVYRARQHSMDREVAVKVLHPSFASDTEAVRRFLHEARAASRLEHPNIITVFDFGRTEDGLLYIVMELVNGRSLSQEIEGGPIAPRRAVHLLAQIADAVHHAHERGLVHRDLKPDNIVFVQGSTLRGDFVKVLDFGIAMMRSYDGMERITRTGAVCGTPAYMSPEQVLGDEVDARCDVYALGVIAYEMLTGVHPLPADTPMRQMLAHLESPVPRMAAVAKALELPPGLEEAVLHALEKSPESRTPSVMAFASELVAAIGGSDLSVQVPGLASAVGEGRRATPAPRAKSSPGAARPLAQGGGAADTARALTSPTTSPGRARRWRSTLAYGAVVAVLSLAVVFLATRSDGAGETKDAGGAPLTAMPVSNAPGARDPVRPAPERGDEALARSEASTPDLGADASVVGAGDADASDATAVAAAGRDAGPGDGVEEEDTGAVAVVARVIKVSSRPRGATVTIDGVEAGVTPVDVTLPVGDATVELVLKKGGYRPETRTLDAASEDLSLTLTRNSGPRVRSDAPPIVR